MPAPSRRPGPAAHSDQLRTAIRNSGLAVKELAREAGVDAGMIFRFLSGERGLTTRTVDAVAEVLGLRLIEGPRARPRVQARPEPRPGRPARPRSSRPTPAIAGDQVGDVAEKVGLDAATLDLAPLPA